MKNEIYTLIKSNFPHHHEVMISFTNEKGKTIRQIVYVKDKANASDKYYIDEAKKQFIKPKKAKHISKKLVITLASIAGVAAIAAGVTLGVTLGNKTVIVQKDKFDKMKDYYRDYLIRTTNIDRYKNLTAQQILEQGAYWKTEENPITHEKEDIRTPLVKKTMVGVTTYYMKDIDYTFGSDRASWPAASHVSQATAIAVTAAVKNDPAIMDIAVGMTYYWVYNNFRNTNWWQNELGAGGSGLANLGLFTYEHLNSQGRSMLVSKVANASFYYRPSILTHAGTNLFDYADITLRSSIFTKTDEEFDLVVSRIGEEITDRHLEGFQQDGSFFQHGQQVQIASYGKGVIRLAKVLKALSVSGESFNPTKMNIIKRYLLTGLRNMTHKGYLNYSAVSRELVRRDALSASSSGFAQFSEYLDIPEFPEKEELKAYLDSIENETACAEELTYFDRARMISMNLDGLYMSFKGTADYLTNTECVNGENKLGLNLSYGTNTCVMDTGNEYAYATIDAEGKKTNHNISPLWNYAYIPGTTSIQLVAGDDTEETLSDENSIIATDELIANEIVHERYGDELYEEQLPSDVGVTEVTYGGKINEDNNPTDPTKVAVLTQRSVHHGENEFAVTCIASKFGMLLLGAELSYTGSKTGDLFTENSRKLHTTLEQCFYDESKAFEISPDNKKLTYGNAVYKIVDSLDGTSPNKTITCHSPIDLEFARGWARNRTPADTESTESLKASGKVLLAYIQHDSATQQSYAYSIQPKSIADVESNNFKIYHNLTQGVQEVELPNGTTVIVSFISTDPEHKFVDHNDNEYSLLKGDIIING